MSGLALRSTSSDQELQRRLFGATQLRPDHQAAISAPPPELLQQAVLPEPSIHSAQALIPMPRHQLALALTVGSQSISELLANAGRAQSITALPDQFGRHRTIQNPGTDLREDVCE
jgi:hypothetical protein